jgi:murein DD-endopeptidase MepM/ murein hydrolase activator NlpD
VLARGADALLAAFAQILLSRSRAAGLCILLAAAWSPPALACAGLTFLGAALAARLMAFDGAAFADGAYGGNAIFVGLGVGWAFGLTLTSGVLALSLGAACLVVTALFGALGRAVALPVLSLPFVLVYDLALAAAPGIGLGARLGQTPAHASSGLAAMVSGMGALVFSPRLEAGLLMLVALLIHSRISFSLAVVAGLVVTPFVGLSHSASALAPTLVLNAVLTSMALGGAWFIPSAPSFGLAAMGTLLSVFLTVALERPLGALGLPVLVLPFNVAVAAVLCAAALRTRNARPVLVDFIPGSPEQNLRYDLTRSARGLADAALRLRLPFRGSWCCTQGVDGAYTHQGPWRHAADFEVQGSDGAFFSGDARRLDSYHCFRLPVLAAADGTVARIENHVPDNAIGDVDLRRNWGNVVVIQHGAGLFSLVAHLAQGSVSVRPGQSVRRGDVVGLCGSSGRSPRPHLHFQVQATDVLGAPTLPLRFHHACLHAPASAEPARLVRLAEPAAGEIWSQPEPGAALGALVAGAMPDAGSATFSVNGREETLTFGVDLLGRQVVRAGHGGVLFFSRDGERLCVLDVIAPRGSVLHALRAALSQVPLLGDESIRWRDLLPPGRARPPLLGALQDFAAPFLPAPPVEMEYHLERRRDRLGGERLAIVGQSRGQAAPIIRTRAEIAPDLGLMQLLVATERRVWQAVRVAQPPLAPVLVLPRDPARASQPVPRPRTSAGRQGC